MASGQPTIGDRIVFMIIRDLLEEGTLENPLLWELLRQDRINCVDDLNGLKSFKFHKGKPFNPPPH